jgi:hypothetical protein
MNYLDDLNFQKALIKERKKRKPQIKLVLLTEEQKQIEMEDYLGSTVSDAEFYYKYINSLL